MSVTANLGITLLTQAQGSKEVTCNAAITSLDSAVAGVLSKSVAGSSNVTLTAAEALNAVLTLTGVLTGNINVIVPTANKVWTIFNNTTGAFTLTVKTAAGTGIAVTQATYAILYCNGTNVLQAVMAAAGGGGAALSAITAAAAANTIDNTDYAQVWKWKLTTASKIGLNITEPTAGTGSTSVLVQINTLGSSATIPLIVKTGGVEAMRVPTGGNAQVLLGDGTVSWPALGFQLEAGGNSIGLYRVTTGQLGVTDGVSQVANFKLNNSSFSNGTAVLPAITSGGVGGNTGINPNASYASATAMQVIVGAHEHTSFFYDSAVGAGAQIIRTTHASADALGMRWDVRKNRGTVASPTVITTGDVMFDINPHAYVGATGLHVNCARVSFLTEGTIANTTTGVGGVIKFFTMAVGSAIAERGRIDSKGNFIVGTAALGTTVTDGFLYIPTCAGTPTGVPTTYTGLVPMIFDTTGVKFWLYTGGAWKGVVVA